MVDKSIQNNKNEGHSEGVAFINNCVKEVCLNNDELIKYKKFISNFFPDEPDFYTKLEDFIALVNSHKAQERLTNTSINNIKFLAKNLHIEEQTIDMIMKSSKEEMPDPPKDYKLITICIVLLLAIVVTIGFYYAFNQDHYPSYYYDDPYGLDSLPEDVDVPENYEIEVVDEDD